MAAPWWLQDYSYQDSGGEPGSGGYIVSGQRDIRTGRPVYQQDGKYYYSLPRPEMGDGEGGTYAAIPGESVADQNAPQLTAQFIPGYNAPYGNLGGEVGMVNGKPTYLFPMNRGATTAGDIGIYGGAQRAFWRSPSGAQGQVVQGPDGNMWVAPPPDAVFSEADIADHSTVLGELQKTYGPLISAALPFTGVGRALSSALGTIGGSAATGALSSLASGGDPLKGAVGGAIGAGASSLGGPILQDAGVSPELSKVLIGGATSALTGGNPLLAALSAATPALTSTGGEITGPMAETPVVGSEGGGYPGAEIDFEATQPESPVSTAGGSQFDVLPSAQEPEGFYPGTQFDTLPQDQEPVSEAPDLPPLEYTPEEPGVKIPQNILAKILGIDKQQPIAPTSPAPAGQTRTLSSPEMGTTTSPGFGLAASPDQAIGAGELEPTRTGKKRRKVWNVASLKNLQDALGV
jgi:hypothetical protein